MSRRRMPPKKAKEVIHIMSDDESPKYFYDGKEIPMIDLSKSDDEDLPPPPKKARLFGPAPTNVLAEKDINGNGKEKANFSYKSCDKNIPLSKPLTRDMVGSEENASRNNVGTAASLMSSEEIDTLMRKWVDEGIEMVTREANGIPQPPNADHSTSSPVTTYHLSIMDYPSNQFGVAPPMYASYTASPLPSNFPPNQLKSQSTAYAAQYNGQPTVASRPSASSHKNVSQNQHVPYSVVHPQTGAINTYNYLPQVLVPCAGCPPYPQPSSAYDEIGS